MPTYVLTIDGVTKSFLQGSFKPALVMNSRDALTFNVYSEAGAYNPPLEAEVIITEDGDDFFGGYLDKIEKVGIGGEATPNNVLMMTCVSFDVLADRRVVTETYAAGMTLEDVLIDLHANYLDEPAWGITMDPAQATGFTLDAELVIIEEYLSDVLNKLAARTGGWGWKISPSKVFGMYDPVTTAPFSIADADSPTKMVGQARSIRTAQKKYNWIRLTGGQNVVLPWVDNFVGDGSTDSFQLTHPIQGVFPPEPEGAVGYAVVDINGYESIATLPAPPDYLWEYDPDTHIITRRLGPPDNLQAFSIRYDVQFPIYAEAKDDADIAANGPSEYKTNYPNVYNLTELQGLADQLLAQSSGEKHEVRYKTALPGIRPMMIQAIEISDLQVDGDFLITEVKCLDKETHYHWEVVAVEGAYFKGTFRGTYVAWYANSGGGSTITPTVSTGGMIAPPPLNAILHNYNGKVHGSPHALFEHDTKSIIAGDNNVITAAMYDSIFMFGYDGEVSD